MTAFYNEHDPKAAAWLRELVARNLIAPGVVDESDIRDLRPADLHGYAQCHFFAGIGVWSYALRQAGWDDARPVWTGSCPCQPFSAAGKGAGFDDERHLWPAWFWLIDQCRPATVFGEQVASKDAEPWIDLVSDDLEAVGYRIGAVPFPAAGVGAPHIRDRLYWVADTVPAGRAEGWAGSGHRPASGGGLDGLMAYADDAGPQGRLQRGHGSEQRPPGPGGVDGGLAHARSERIRDHGPGRDAGASRSAQGPGKERQRLRDDGCHDRGERVDGQPSPGPLNGLWRDADWLLCRDGRWRPVEPGTFPLAHGSAARVGRLRGYGNAINAEAARVFIEAYLG